MSALALPLLLAMLVWLAYKLTTYAFPGLIGLLAAHFAFDTGAGWIGAIAVFGVSAAASLEVMRALFMSVAAPTLRIMLAIAFVTPAMAASYFLLANLSVGLVPAEAWRQVICVLGASVAGSAALGKLAPPEPRFNPNIAPGGERGTPRPAGGGQAP